MLAADVSYSGAALRLPQCAQNLLLRMSLFATFGSSSISFRGPPYWHVGASAYVRIQVFPSNV
jgi:hypothetical protein